MCDVRVVDVAVIVSPGKCCPTSGSSRRRCAARLSRGALD